MSFFWPSFADLMTSLFFIMLVFYMLTYFGFSDRLTILQNELKATKEELEKLNDSLRVTEQQLKIIDEIQAAIKELPKKYFAYDSPFKRYSLVQNIEFARGKDDIKHKDKEYLEKVGSSISSLIHTLKSKHAKHDIKYLVIIEGMASNDKYIDNFPLSYKRALAVFKLWERRGIVLDKSVCEIQIAGSGISGIGRYPRSEEMKNQRILIQIVPKIGQINIE